MAKRILAILVILVSWSAMLYASSQDCSGYEKNVPKSLYDELLKIIQKKTKQNCSEKDITCLMFTTVGTDKQYCAQVKILSDKEDPMECTVQWDSTGHGRSLSICSRPGNAFSTSNSVHTRHSAHAQNSFPFDRNEFPFNNKAFPLNSDEFPFNKDKFKRSLKQSILKRFN